ncbi:MAG: choice-of-anchor Q domain-containing protein, partial [Pseudobdellovibrionaceae bacterium]
GPINFSTSTGNPMAPSAKTLLTAICGVVNHCHPEVALAQCQSGLLGVAGVGTRLGLASDFNSFSTIIAAEQAGVLVGNPDPGTLCIDKIAATDCSDPLISGVYDPSASQPFNGAVQLVSGPSCNNAFMAVTRYSCPSQVLLKGTAVSLNPLASQSGLEYSISPSLPAGLTFNSSTGQIDGTPSADFPMTDFTITAKSQSGLTNSTLSLRVADGYAVNEITDSSNVGPGCKTSSGGCSLRAAIEASAASGTSQVILVPSATITVNTPLTISKSLEIHGQCNPDKTSPSTSVIDGNHATQIISILDPGGSVTLSDLTIQNGASSTSGGAGISIQATIPSSNYIVSIKDLTIRNNSYTGLSYGGGGLFVTGLGGGIVSLQMSDSTLSGNSTMASGGALEVYSGATVQISRSLFQSNSAVGGGAISLAGGEVRVTESLFLNNSADQVGGAIYGSLSTGNVILTNDTFYGNIADKGSALAGGNSGVFTILNNTIVGNISKTSLGGALSNLNGGTFNLANTIIAANKDDTGYSNCNVGQSLSSQGSNLSDGNDCPLTSAGDLQNTNPQFGPLQVNGGATQTLALLLTSPGLNQGSVALCPQTDQRGVLRLTDGKCDIGAYEAEK